MYRVAARASLTPVSNVHTVRHTADRDTIQHDVRTLSSSLESSSFATYTTTFVSTYLTKKKRSYQHLCPVNTTSTRTVSIIMLHLIIVIKRTTFTNLKHNC